DKRPRLVYATASHNRRSAPPGSGPGSNPARSEPGANDQQKKLSGILKAQSCSAKKNLELPGELANNFDFVLFPASRSYQLCQLPQEDKPDQTGSKMAASSPPAAAILLVLVPIVEPVDDLGADPVERPVVDFEPRVAGHSQYHETQ